jgi:aspartyl/asparaginyl beta-hydroxylase (cupin superfamily)
MYLFILLILIYLVLYIYDYLNLFTVYLALLIILSLYLVLYIFRNPTDLLIPYNSFIESITEKKVFYSEEEKMEIFPTSLKLETNWKEIQRECLNTLRGKELDNIGKKFIVADDSFFEGWKTFELRMFGKDYEENMNCCPVLKKILKSDPNITTAFFSIMEPGKFLSSHYGPFKGILRYHLGLIVPPKDSGLCYISVDGKTYDWQEGEGVLFDETYKHFVENSTPYQRIVLFIDVKRPLPAPVSYMNDLLLYLMSISPYNFN